MTMKLNRLETHDRLEHFKEDQNQTIWTGADDCMRKNPLSLAIQEKSPYLYIFAHPRTDDDGVNKKLFWQPRLSKPKAQTNSYLFRAISKSDSIEVIWLIPPRELWPQYQRGNVTEDPTILWSINRFLYNRFELEQPEHDDMPDSKAQRIMLSIVNEKRESLRHVKPVNEEAFLAS
jgi:hypothetical protein